MGYSKGKRGQLLTTDFILSLAIFLAILLTAMGLWNSVDTQIRDAENRRDMQTISAYVSDTLVRSPGFPQNWTNLPQNKTQVIGLAMDEHVIDMNKVLAFKRMDYDQARFLLRLRNYNFYVWVTDSDGYDLTSGIARSPVAVIARDPNNLVYAGMLNNSVIEWDFYYNSPLFPGGKPPQGYTSRYNYSGANEKDCLSQFMANQTSYRTLIIENLGVNYDDIGVDTTVLKNFVKRGGILIYTDRIAGEGNSLIAGMGVSFQAGTLAGLINQTKPVLWNNASAVKNVTAGMTVTFVDRKRTLWRNYSKGDFPINCIVNKSVSPERCVIGWWDYEFGRVYYIDNPDGTIDGTEPLRPHLNIVGENLTIGRKQTNQTIDLISIRRMAILSGFNREVANFYMTVWR